MATSGKMQEAMRDLGEGMISNDHARGWSEHKRDCEDPAERPLAHSSRGRFGESPLCEACDLTVI